MVAEQQHFHRLDTIWSTIQTAAIMAPARALCVPNRATTLLIAAFLVVTANSCSAYVSSQPQLSITSAGRKLQQINPKEGAVLAGNLSNQSFNLDGMLVSTYSCDEFVLRMRSKLQAATAERQTAAATATRWAWDHPASKETPVRLQVVASELNSCRNILEVGGCPDVNVLRHLSGAHLESVTTVSQSPEPTCEYRASASRPNVLYRHAPQLVQDFAGDVHFDCMVDLGVGCYGSKFAEALHQFVASADVAVIGASARHDWQACARAVVQRAVEAGMQVAHFMRVDISTGDAADRDHLTHSWRSMWVLRRPSFITCQLLDVMYHPSQLEQHWMQRAAIQPFNSTQEYCSEASLFQKPFSKWLEYTGNVNPRDSDADLAVLSQHRYTYQCGKDRIQSVAYLEPLAGHLRYPYAWCNKDKVDIVRYDYLLLASASEPPSKRVRTFLFDVGARTYGIGVGRYPNGTKLPAQQFLVNTYKGNGITFDRMLLWDPQPNSADIFLAAPNDLLPVYSYYNFAASSANDNTNPLVVLKKLCKESDFVALKMDIDFPELEEAWLTQLANDKELHMLIDEFFFEFNPKEAGWQRLGQLYDLMTSLRKAGVRAHGWI